MNGVWFRTIIHEPLVHFFLAGAALFAFTGYYGDVDAVERRIVIDENQVSRLADQWQRQWNRPPVAEELDGLIRDYVREEIYVREAIRLGLDVDDPIIRRRLRSKMEFLATAQVENSAPSDAELMRYYTANKARYARTPSYSFEQRYYGDDEAIARKAVALLNRGGNIKALKLSLPARSIQSSKSDVARLFGDSFADGLKGLPLNKWSGPVRSGYGWHAVRIAAIDTGGAQPLSAIATQVANDWRANTIAEREAAAFQTLLDGYDIRIAKP